MNYRPPELLGPAHELDTFDCSSAEQTDWLTRHARQPVALLARLGVQRDHEHQGLGAALLPDVIQRVAAISDDIGCRGLLVHGESQRARESSLHLIPEFEPCPTDELHPVLLLKDIRKTLRGNGK